MESIRIHVPDEILNGITDAYCGNKRKYTDVGLRNALIGYARNKLKEKLNNRALVECLTHFSIEENYPSIDAIQRFFKRKEGKGIYLKGERNLPNLICYYAYGNDWYDTLEEFGFIEEDLIVKDDIYDSTQPILTVFNTRQYSSKLNFKSRYIPLIGRDEEIEKLDLFWGDKQKFAWWIILGNGGSGKSKLALTYCEKLQRSGSYAGFIEMHNFRRFDWYNWQPKTNTFVVIDYAGTYFSEVIEIIKILETKVFRYSVKLLLLERQSSGKWWNELKRQLKLEYIQIWNEPFRLKPIDDENLLNIFKVVYKKELREINDENSVLSKLKEIDDQRRPLFAILTCIGLLVDERENNKSKIDLIDLYFDREFITWELFCKRNDIPNKVLEKHKNLIAVSNIIRGISESNMDILLRHGYSWLPNIEEFSPELFYIMTNDTQNVDYGLFGFIEPDILGEYFALNTMEKVFENYFDGKNVIHEFTTLVWSVEQIETLSFCQRASFDFASLYKALTIFFSYGNVSFYIDLHKKYFSEMLFLARLCYKAGDIKTMHSLYSRFSVLKNHDGIDYMPLYQSEIAFYCCNILIDQNRFEECEPYYNDVKALKEQTSFIEVHSYYIDILRLFLSHYNKNNDYNLVEIFSNEILSASESTGIRLIYSGNNSLLRELYPQDEDHPHEIEELVRKQQNDIMEKSHKIINKVELTKKLALLNLHRIELLRSRNSENEGQAD